MSNFPKRFYLYLKERFPPFLYFIFILLFFFSIYLSTEPAKFSCFTILGFLTVFLVFLHLRLMDEIKDFEEDKLYFPDRPVQRGLISLKEIKVVLLITIFAEILLNMFLSLKIFISFLFVLFYSFLMFFEFFLKKILRKNILYYSLPHLLIIPLLAFYIFQYNPDFALAPHSLLLLIFVYSSGLCLEISRKLTLPSSHLPPFYSYTHAIGFKNAFLILIFSHLVSIFLILYFLILRGKNFSIPLGYLIFSLFSILYSFFLFQKTSPDFTKKITFSYNIYVFITYLFVLIASL